MIRLGKVFGNMMVDLRATNRKLRDRSERILMEMCEIDRPMARGLLDRADGSVKLAIAMYWTGVNADEAKRLLQQSGGRLGELREARPAGGA
jgi:N-acetylmuramic acid 6-phosphate etherase